ncbi:hypothetical protein CKA32_001059 [Geitlerinema sp. FC II]|nr:hypothetical protein CKA32_001059 [Geitlerinema sp. FC II]
MFRDLAVRVRCEIRLLKYVFGLRLKPRNPVVVGNGATGAILNENASRGGG